MGRPTMPDPVGRIEGTLLTYIKYDHTHPKNGKHAVLSVSVGQKSHPAVHGDPQDHQELWLSEEDTREPSRLTYIRHDHYKKFKVSRARQEWVW